MMTINWGGAGTGAVGGATMGSRLGPWGAVAGGGLGALAGLFGGEGKEAQPGGYQWLQQPEYQNVGTNMGTIWDYLGRGIQALQEGKPPTWFQQWAPLEEYQRKNKLTGTYYGKGAGAAGGNLFGPGILATQQATDIAAGRRGAGAGSNYAKQLQMYGQGMTDIDNYLSQLGATAMQGAEQQYLSSAANLPRGPQGQWMPYGETAYQPSGTESILGAVGQMAPYMQRYQAPTATTGYSPALMNEMNARFGEQMQGLQVAPGAYNPYDYMSYPGGSRNVYNPFGLNQ